MITVANAHAQDVTVHLSQPNAVGQGTVTAFGYYMSPYDGTVTPPSPSQLTTFYCVDFFHDVTLGESWQAHITNLGELVALKNLGDLTELNALLGNTRDGSDGDLNPLNIYESVAWLTTNFPANPAGNNASTTDASISTAIQTAIWYLASNTAATPSPNYFGGAYNYQSNGPLWDNGQQTGLTAHTLIDDGTPFSTGYWVDQAAQAIATIDAAPDHGQAYFSDFNILTDVDINDPSCPTTGVNVNPLEPQYVCTAQEFLFTTPEPGTTALMGTGLLAVVGGTVRRRRRAASRMS